MQQEIITININNLEEMKHFAEKIAEVAKIGDVITLSGNLGAGKTSFVQFFVKFLNKTDIDVTSPTFNLVHIYELNDKEIWHFDLYRLKSQEEIYEIGIEDALINSISLIEWPEIILEVLPKNRLELEILFSDSAQNRVIKCKSSEKWHTLLLSAFK